MEFNLILISKINTIQTASQNCFTNHRCALKTTFHAVSVCEMAQGRITLDRYASLELKWYLNVGIEIAMSMMNRMSHSFIRFLLITNSWIAVWELMEWYYKCQPKAVLNRTDFIRSNQRLSWPWRMICFTKPKIIYPLFAQHLLMNGDVSFGKPNHQGKPNTFTFTGRKKEGFSSTTSISNIKDIINPFVSWNSIEKSIQFSPENVSSAVFWWANISKHSADIKSMRKNANAIARPVIVAFFKEYSVWNRFSSTLKSWLPNASFVICMISHFGSPSLRIKVDDPKPNELEWTHQPIVLQLTFLTCPNRWTASKSPTAELFNSANDWLWWIIFKCIWI